MEFTHFQTYRACDPPVNVPWDLIKETVRREGFVYPIW